MCGIGGVFAKDSSSYADAVSLGIGIGENISHRGKDNFGISSVNLNYSAPVVSRIRSNQSPQVVFPTMKVEAYKDINPSLYNHLVKLNSPASLVHTRFTTSGTYDGISNCQPIIYFLDGKRLEALNSSEDGLFHFDFVPDSEDGWICLAHNGEVNKKKLEQLIKDAGYRNKDRSVSSDTGALAAYLLMGTFEKGSIAGAIKSVSENVPGSWSLLGMISFEGEFGAFAARDKYGVRPLERTAHTIGSDEYLAYASENAAFKRLGIKDYSTVMPGEADILRYVDGKLECETVHIADPIPRMCAFEVMYNMPPENRIPFHVRIFDPKYESVVRGEKSIEEYRKERLDIVDRTATFDVSTIRERIGELFYKAFGYRVGSHDVLCGVPNSGNSYAYGYGRASGEQPKEVIFINPTYRTERSFQRPTDKERKETINKKLLYKPIGECLGPQEVYNRVINGRNGEYGVVGFEDSIVTGNAVTVVGSNLRLPPEKGGSGAKDVQMLSATPPIIYGCALGINMKEDRLLVKTVAKLNGILNPDEWALSNPQEFETEAAKFVGADAIIFSKVPFMQAIFDKNTYGFSCIGAMPCAPSE